MPGRACPDSFDLRRLRVPGRQRPEVEVHAAVGGGGHELAEGDGAADYPRTEEDERARHGHGGEDRTAAGRLPEQPDRGHAGPGGAVVGPNEQQRAGEQTCSEGCPR